MVEYFEFHSDWFFFQFFSSGLGKERKQKEGEKERSRKGGKRNNAFVLLINRLNWRFLLNYYLYSCNVRSFFSFFTSWLFFGLFF